MTPFQKVKGKPCNRTMVIKVMLHSFTEDFSTEIFFFMFCDVCLKLFHGELNKSFLTAPLTKCYEVNMIVEIFDGKCS